MWPWDEYGTISDCRGKFLPILGIISMHTSRFVILLSY